MIPFSSPGFDQLRLASAGHDSAAVCLDLRFEQRFKQHCDKLDFQLVFTSTHVLVVEENSQYVSFTFSSVVKFVSMSAGKQAKRDLEHKQGRYFREKGRFAQKGLSLKLATRAFPIFENVKKDSHKRVLTQIVYPCLPQAPHQPPEHCFYLFPSVSTRAKSVNRTTFLSPRLTCHNTLERLSVNICPQTFVKELLTTCLCVTLSHRCQTMCHWNTLFMKKKNQPHPLSSYCLSQNSAGLV